MQDKHMVQAKWKDTPWRVRQEEMESLMRLYEEDLAEDYAPLLHPTKLERYLLHDDVRLLRLKYVQESLDANRDIVKAVRDWLPTIVGEIEEPDRVYEPPPAKRSLMKVREFNKEVKYLPAGSYGTIKSLFLHLFRDWSEHNEHVLKSTYRPAVEALKAAGVPKGSEILLPGCGMCRLAYDVAQEGYNVEVNDASRLFVTAAEWLLNYADEGQPFYPLAHLFQENWSVEDQYFQAHVSLPKAADGETLPSISMAPGDFTSLYSPDGLCHRRFDAIVTCFFMDTLVDLAEFVGMLSCLLAPGGVWVNVGPLHFHDEAKLKLSWEEIAHMVETSGFQFEEQRMITCDYHLPWGVKMFSESYCCVLAVARRIALPHEKADAQADSEQPPATPAKPITVTLPDGKVVSLREMPPQAHAGDFLKMLANIMPPPEDSKYVLKTGDEVLADDENLRGDTFTVLVEPLAPTADAEGK